MPFDERTGFDGCRQRAAGRKNFGEAREVHRARTDGAARETVAVGASSECG